VPAAGSCSHRDLPKRVCLICIALNDADRMEGPFGQVPNFEGAIGKVSAVSRLRK
jgi:hypothetical protein